MRILIVEDELRLAEALAHLIEEQKYMVDTVYDGEDGLLYGLSGQYDVIVLDVMLPKRNGYEVVKALRSAKIQTPILMLTAKDDLQSKITGLDCGADDYMIKPFSPEELTARIRALSRRQGNVILDELSFGDLVLNLSTYDLSCNNKSVRLGYKEYKVLKILISNSRAVTSKEDLISKVWGVDSNADDNNVEAYISLLRKKIYFLNSAVTIGTIRKVGYRLEINS
ncbi:MAG: response regulator transcription factor [Clostridia bacterium]|nr:response regulator transcription factor [Clostridia bacterium]